MNKVEHNSLLNREEVLAGKVRLRSKPLQVNIELTGVCNINPPCLFCTGKNFGHNYSPLDVSYLEKYRDFLDCCRQINEDSFGEPLTHRDLVDLAREVTENGQVFSFVTNGLPLSAAKADQLASCGPRLGVHVSFNAATHETFYKLTGKSFAKVVENTRYYVESYKKQNGDAPFHLILTFIVMKINRSEVRDFLKLASELGAPRVLLASLHDRPSVPLGDFGYRFVYEEEIVPFDQLEKIGEEALALAGELGLKCLLQWDAARDSAIQTFSESESPVPCLVPWRFLFIQEHSQQVFACPYHRLPYGDLSQRSLEEIWNGPEAQQMRSELVAGEIPKLCWDVSAGCPLVMAARQERGASGLGDCINMGENDDRHCDEGWFALERIPDPARWTRRSASFRLLRGDGAMLSIQMLAGAADRPMKGAIELGGLVVGEFFLEKPCWEWSHFQFEAPDVAPDSMVHGRIVLQETWCPDRVVGNGDTRELGVAVHRIGFGP